MENNTFRQRSEPTAHPKSKDRKNNHQAQSPEQCRFKTGMPRHFDYRTAKDVKGTLTPNKQTAVCWHCVRRFACVWQQRPPTEKHPSNPPGPALWKRCWTSRCWGYSAVSAGGTLSGRQRREPQQVKPLRRNLTRAAPATRKRQPRPQPHAGRFPPPGAATLPPTGTHGCTPAPDPMVMPQPPTAITAASGRKNNTSDEPRCCRHIGPAAAAALGAPAAAMPHPTTRLPWPHRRPRRNKPHAHHGTHRTPEPTSRPRTRAGAAPNRPPNQQQTALYVAVGIAVVCAGIVAAVLIQPPAQNTQGWMKQRDEKSLAPPQEGRQMCPAAPQIYPHKLRKQEIGYDGFPLEKLALESSAVLFRPLACGFAVAAGAGNR